MIIDADNVESIGVVRYPRRLLDREQRCSLEDW